MKKLICTISKFKQLTVLIYRNNWRYVWTVVIMCIIIFVFDALSPSIFVGMIFDALSLGDTQYLIETCLQIIPVLGVVLLVGLVFFTYSDAWFTLIANRSCSKLFLEFFKMPHAEVLNQVSEGEIYNRLVMGATHTISVFAASTQFISTAASSVILLLMLVNQSSQFLWAAVAYFLVVAVRISFETNKNMAFHRNIQQSAAKQTQQIHILLENLEQAKMCGMTSVLEGQWVEDRKTYWYWKNKKDRMRAVLEFISGVGFGCFQAAVYVVLQIIQPSMAVISSAITLLNRYNDNLTIACENAANLPSYFVPIDRLIDFLQKYKGFDTGVMRQKMCKSTEIVLSLSNVSLAVNENQILQNVCFSIKQNEKVALIGQNGSGKSTVLRAVMGQFHLNDGEISIFAENPEYPLSYIPVTSQMFSVSSLANISMGTTLPESEFKNSIDLEFLEQKATDLSGGQQQRINIYRAVVGKRELLLADEPTSALNSELKDAYMELIMRSSASLLVVTHDPLMLSHFDKIVILDHGRVVESGKYRHIIQTDAYSQWIGSLYHTCEENFEECHNRADGKLTK